MVCFKLNGQNHDCTPEFRKITSFIVLTISNSDVVLKLCPSFLSNSFRYLDTSRPATSTLIMECGIANPS